MSTLDPANSTISFAGTAILDNVGIKGAASTANTPQTYAAGSLTAAAAALPCARRITAVLAAHASSYVLNSTITITGTDKAGNAQTEVLTVPGTGGGVTITSVKFFKSVTQLDIQSQADALGSISFGVSDALVNARAVRCGTSGNLHVQFANGQTDVVPKVAAGEMLPMFVSVVFGDSTVQDITALR